MCEEKVVKHPLADLGALRKVHREGTSTEIRDAIRQGLMAVHAVADVGLATDAALPTALGAFGEMTEEEQISRTADALVQAYLPQSWDAVIAAARELERREGDFARKVLQEVERRHHDAVTGT